MPREAGADRAPSADRSPTALLPVLALLLPLAVAPAVSADLPWSRAELVAKKLFLSGHTTLELGSGGSPDVVTLRVDSRFAGRETSSRLEVDRRTGATLLREKTRHGGDPYCKTYRFGRDAVHEERRSPRSDGERDQGPEGWSEVRETEHPIPPACRAPIHPEALFWLLATEAPAPGDPPLERCAFTGDGFARLTIEAVGFGSRDAAFLAGEATAVDGVGGSRDVLELRLDGRALDGDAAQEIDFLGLEGTIGLVLDAETGAPVEVTGDVSPLGGVVVRLERLER